ncbi:MAG: hypothetical protein CME57_07575 [Halieaceae bacterium]|nr:hypothetical protein [Halieaceae bacterium]
MSLFKNIVVPMQCALLISIADNVAQAQDAEAYYVSNVETIVQSKCRGCHQSGGRASYTPLIYTDSAPNNHRVFEAYVNDPSPGARADRVLGKIRGALGHGGGTVISAGTANYQVFEQYMAYFDTVEPAIEVPGAPTDVTAVAGDRLAVVSFTPPSDDGGAEITRYTVRSNPGQNQSRCSGSPCEVDELSNGTSYTFTVTASNEAGDGPASSPSNAVTPAAPAVLRVVLEEPVAREIHTGVGNIRGWAVASDGITKVEVWIDGAYAFDAPYGGERGDVGGAFPDIDDSANSGFSAAYNYSNLSAGTHSISALAYTGSGETKESKKQFEVVRFPSSYIADKDAVDLSSASCALEGDEISVTDALVDEGVYDLRLKWRTAEQGFEIVEIR